LNITPEKDLTRRHCHYHRFLRKETVVTIATIDNDFGSLQWQWWEQVTTVETEAAEGAHNNQPTNGSDMAAETAFAAAAAATTAAVAAAVATAAMVATVAMVATAATAMAQTVAGSTGVREIYIKKGRKRRSLRRWQRRRRLWRKLWQPQQ
jgi:hypothetical protein